MSKLFNEYKSSTKLTKLCDGRVDRAETVNIGSEGSGRL